MNDQEEAVFINLRHSTPEQVEDTYIEKLKQSSILKDMGKYEKAFQIQLTKPVQIMMITICEEDKDCFVNCWNHLFQWSFLHQTSHIDLDIFATQIFPNGFPDFSKPLKELIQ